MAAGLATTVALRLQVLLLQEAARVALAAKIQARLATVSVEQQTPEAVVAVHVETVIRKADLADPASLSFVIQFKSMAHFAKIVDGTVVNVIVAEPEFFNSFVDDTPGQWLQASYNTRGGIHYQPNSNEPSADQSKALRMNYPGVGYTYDADRDAFIAPPPFLSWVLDEATCLWQPPVAMPDDGKAYVWNEAEVRWDVAP